jgi:glutathione S-transferase
VRIAPEQRDMAAIQASAEKLGQTFAILDNHLVEHRFVAGDSLTIGDIPVGAACYRYHNLPVRRPALPALEAWYDRLTEREAFRTNVMIPLT